MMDWTDRHCRYFLRGFSPRVLLYTEMITAEALLRGDAAGLLRHAPEEQPLALQLGGSEPARMASAARLGEQAGYVEVNMNCGCPSDRVHAGAFGACLMAEPQRVAECVAAMRAAVSIPVTVKMRIGVIDGAKGVPMRERLATYGEDDYARLVAFTTAVAAAGCEVFIVHARQAVLGGLSPKENRDVPPLRPQSVRRLKEQFPKLCVVLNGGIRTAPQALEALGWGDGVMLGREAYHRPYLLSELHQLVTADGWQRPEEGQLLERMCAYAERELASGTPLAAISRHMFGLYAGRPGARSYRQHLSEAVRVPGASAGVLKAARLPTDSEGLTAAGTY
jgi:tRNA-dihydrouridine synthase A